MGETKKRSSFLLTKDDKVYILSIYNSYCVRGNCDHFSRLPERRIIHTPYGALLMTHLPYLPVDIAKQYNIKIFIYGHTHRRKFELVNGVYYINPGAISFPRDGFDLSYAIVTITPEKVEVEFKTLLD